MSYLRTQKHKDFLREKMLGTKYTLGKHWKLSKKTKQKMSLSKKGKVSNMKGKKHSDESKMKMKFAKLNKKGKLANNWKGGISKTSSKRWLKKGNNYDRKIFLNLKRRVIKLDNGGSHSFKEWENLKAQYNFTCPCCKKQEPKIKLTEDHTIPLSKGGSHNIENIQPLCRSCNCKKHTNIIKYV